MTHSFKARELIQAGRREVVLDAARLARNRQRIAARLASGGLAAGSLLLAGEATASGALKAGAAAWLKLTALALATAGGVGAGVYALGGGDQSERGPAPAAMPSAAPGPVRARPQPPAPASEATLSGDAPALSSALAAPPQSARREAPSPTQLREHALHLREARASLSRGDAAGALRILDAHREVATGPLSPEWMAARVLVLCRLGRVGEAQKQASWFFKQTKDSPLSAQVRASCVAEPQR